MSTISPRVIIASASSSVISSTVISSPSVFSPPPFSRTALES